MFAGRVLSLCAFVIWTIALALTARRLGCGWAESAFAAVLLAVNILVFVDYYVGVNDPQLLAHAVSAFAPFVLLREPRTHGSLFGCALLFAAGIFVKHNLVAIPLACVVWLLWFDRRAGWRLMAYGAVVGVAGLAGCIAAFSPGFLEHLSAPRSSSVGKLLLMIRQVAPMLVIPLTVVIVLIRRLRHDPQVMFGVLLAAAGTLVAIGSFYKGGVYWNTMFDAAWGLGLTAALALTRLTSIGGIAGARWRWGLAAAYLVVPLAVVAGSASVHWGSPRFWLDPRWSERESTAREVAFVSSTPGPALCENLAICSWAGKPAEVDFFSMSERIRLDPQADAPLVALIEAQRFRVAQLDFLHYLGPRFDAALTRRYALDHEGRAGALLLPR